MAETYELHIDESGTFGDWPLKPGERESACRVIGGIVVPAALAAREQELKEALMPVREKYFPEERHITGIHLSETKGEDRRRIRQDLRRFFQEQMAEARIVFIYDRTPPEEMETVPGARFYRNMLFRLLQTVLFLHPDFDPMDKFALKLAHRRFSYASKYEDYLAGKGYLKLRSATDGHTVLTAVTGAELETSLDSIRKALPFPNERAVACTVKTYAQWDTPFMVMADWICNTLLGLLGGNQTDNDIFKATENFFGKGSILFLCSSDFELPETLVSAFRREKADQFLAWYMLREKRTYIQDRLLLYPAYQKVMENFVRRSESLTDEQCATLTGIADHFLQKRIYGRLSDVRQLLDIQAGRMKEIRDGSPDEQRDRLAWRYHDAGLRFANHTGNITLGRFHHQQGNSLFARLPGRSLDDTREYHLFINRAAVISANEFAFDRSNSLLMPIYQKEKQLTKLLGEVQNETYGKICGTMAQNCAFLLEKDKAEEYFNIAAMHLLNKSDLSMQASFRAHFAIDNNDSATFLKEAATVLGTAGFPGYREGLEKCLEKSDLDVFTVHLLLKGLIVFTSETTPKEKQEIWKRLYRTISGTTKFNHHPWQLLFTVAGRLLLLLNEKETAREMWRIAANVFSEKEERVTLVMLVQQARAWEALSWLEAGDTRKAIDALQPVSHLFQDSFSGSAFPGIWNPGRKTGSGATTGRGWFDGIGERLASLATIGDSEDLERLCTDFLGRFTFNYW